MLADSIPPEFVLFFFSFFLLSFFVIIYLITTICWCIGEIADFSWKWSKHKNVLLSTTTSSSFAMALAIDWRPWPWRWGATFNTHKSTKKSVLAYIHEQTCLQDIIVVWIKNRHIQDSVGHGSVSCRPLFFEICKNLHLQMAENYFVR